MATIITRQEGATAKGSPLTNKEVDDNFISLNTAKLEASNIIEGFGVSLEKSGNNITIYVTAVEGFCKNVSGSSIPKGTPVYQVGNIGQTLTVAPADASNPAKMPAIGCVGETLANEAEGELIFLGKIQGVNTSTFAIGDEIYVGSGGGYTNVKPANGSGVLIQFLGIVNRVNANNGSGVIFGTAQYLTQTTEITDNVLFNRLNVTDKATTRTNLDVNSTTEVTNRAIQMAIALG
jgi:hypothetical protein